MIIYRCDKCGKEHRVFGVAKNLHKQHGFEQLAISIPGVTDVCADCFKEVSKAWIEARRQDQDERQSRFQRLLGWRK